jgi:molecular chaperone GrpE
MAKKPELEDIDLDGFPSHDELDALQAQIDKAAKEAKKREENDEAKDATGNVEPELSELDVARARIETLETEFATLKDQALRALADAENTKKRAEREVKAASTYGIERLAADMLSVSDNLSRALSVIDEKARETMGDNAKNLVEGIELTEKELIAVFARHGIKAVHGKGSKFDPNVHQAVAQIPSSETKGDVAEVMQTGFTLGDRTLRAAMVAVSTGPAKV